MSNKQTIEKFTASLLSLVAEFIEEITEEKVKSLLSEQQAQTTEEKEEVSETTTTTTQRQNIDKEQFFTQFETAERLSNWIKSQPWFENVTDIIEPSAGDGAWLKFLPVTKAYDLEPRSEGIVQADYLETKIPYKEKTLIVGNPPFGRMGSLAMEFVKKGCEEADYIAYILPASFGKKSVMRRLPKKFHLLYQEDLLDETFRFERDGRKVSVVFQVWERRAEDRKDPVLRDSCKDFSFIKVNSPPSGPAKPAPDNADIAICTHGSGYGKIHLSNHSDLNSRTHRFIKSNIESEKLAQRLGSIAWEDVAKYTVGAPCLSTKEIVYAYENKFSGV